MNRAFDLIAPRAGFVTPQACRGALLLTMAGLLEFPPTRTDGLWSAALRMLNPPGRLPLLVRAFCITEADHDAPNYYGCTGLR